MVSRKENIRNGGPLKFGGARILGVFQQATRIACGKRFITLLIASPSAPGNKRTTHRLPP